MGGKIGAILLTVVIIGVALWVYNSGLIGKGAQGFASLFPVHSSTTSSGSTFATAPSTGLQGAQPGTTIGPAPTSSGGRTIDPSQIPAGFTAAQLSPYFHEVRIGTAYSGGGTAAGQISLYTNYLSQQETVDITGWQLKALRGGEFIPQAINFYDPSGLTAASDIRMKSGDTVYLYSTSAPFNVRINECIGYIAHTATFSPPLPLNCPAPSQSDIQNFTGACQNYIYSIGACQQPNLSDPRIPQNDSSCRDYLANNFTYRSCVDAHENDANFLGNQIWVWTGSNILDAFHDKLELLDSNGLLVDVSSY